MIIAKYNTVCGKCSTRIGAGASCHRNKSSRERTAVRCMACGPHTADVLRRKSERADTDATEECRGCGVTLRADTAAFRVVGSSEWRCDDCGPDPSTDVPARKVKTKSEREREGTPPSSGRPSIAEPALTGTSTPDPVAKEAFPAAPLASTLDEQALRKIADVMTRQLLPLEERIDAINLRLRRVEEHGTEALEKRMSALEAHPPLRIEVTTPRGVVAVEGSHGALREVLEYVKAGITNIYLVGPAGCGKTTIARDLAKALSLGACEQSLSAGVTEAQLFGTVLPQSDGTWSYVPSALVDTYKSGGILLLDEVDAADPNVLVAANSAIANGHLSTRGGIFTRHTDTVILCAANTYGTGADVQYVGRNQLDAAFLDRFAAAQISVGYDGELEQRIATQNAGDVRLGESVLGWVRRVRRSLEQSKLRRTCSTRTVVNASKLARSGWDLTRIHNAYTAGWSSDERAKVASCAS